MKIKKTPQIGFPSNIINESNNIKEETISSEMNVIKWKTPDIPPYYYENKTVEIKKFGYVENFQCRKKFTVNNSIKYAKLENVVLFPNGVIINDNIIFQHQNSCLSSNEEVQKAQQMYAHFKKSDAKINKAIFVSHNSFSSISERMIKEHPLLALLPSHLFNREYTLMVSDDYSEYEKQILLDFGVKSLKMIRPVGTFIEELYIVDGPGCSEYSTAAISLFNNKFLQKTGFSGIEPKSVVLAYNTEKESNSLESITILQKELDDYFKDVTFYISKKNDNYLDEIKFWENSKVVISSTEATNGNEIWLQSNSILIMLQTSDCYTEPIQVAADQGIQVIAAFLNTGSFNGVWFNDIIQHVEDVLIENHLTMKSKSIKDDPDDIF